MSESSISPACVFASNNSLISGTHERGTRSTFRKSLVSLHHYTLPALRSYLFPSYLLLLPSLPPFPPLLLFFVHPTLPLLSPFPLLSPPPPLPLPSLLLLPSSPPHLPPQVITPFSVAASRQLLHSPQHVSAAIVETDEGKLVRGLVEECCLNHRRASFGVLPPEQCKLTTYTSSELYSQGTTLIRAAPVANCRVASMLKSFPPKPRSGNTSGGRATGSMT